MVSIQMSKFQQEQVRRREARIAHRVLDISFSKNYILCDCGAQLQALASKHDLSSPFWTAHLREHGQAAA